MGYGRAKGRPAFAVLFGLLLCCSGCATSPRGGVAADEADSDNDPAEGVNRAIFKANLAVDRAVMKPVAKAYTEHVPDAVQTGVHNVVQNLKEPAVAINDLLQGNVGNAWQSVQRLTVNSTIGVTGVVDVAAKWGLPPHKADTVALLPRERIEVAFVADNPGLWMFHCHILEHQETGMMGYLKVA